MSWVQWQGATWPTTDDEADIDVWLPAVDEGGPRQVWRLDLGHIVRRPPVGDAKLGEAQMHLSLTIEDLGLRGISWHELSGLTIRSTAEWYDRVEAVGPYGSVLDTNVHLSVMWKEQPEGATEERWHMEDWMATDFILTLGRRDGLCFACELDVWAMPKEDFCRLEPETEAELKHFAEGPPTLRVMCVARFTGGSMEMERCGGDPLPLARRRICEQIGCEEFFVLDPTWAVRMTPDSKGTERLPGWRSTVPFRMKR